MQVQPAHIDQIRQAEGGGMVMVDADVGGVAADLKRIDPELHVYFAARARNPFWEVRCEPRDRPPYRVLTVQAHQSATGIWTGLDQRVVKRFEEIDPRGRGEYNYADELERSAARREQRAKQQFAERVGGQAEVAAFQTRKDLGERYKGRTFVPRDVSA